jgi:four helix bundle protein
MNCRFIKNAEYLNRRFLQLLKIHFPKEERFLLTAQTLDAARSITANIAEGFGRYHYQENIQFCRQSRGSLTEVMEHFITAYDDKYIPREILKEINLDYKVCLRDINSYIKYLKAAKVQANN